MYSTDLKRPAGGLSHCTICVPYLSTCQVNSDRPTPTLWHASSVKKTACCISSGHRSDMDRAPAARLCCSSACLIGLDLYGVTSCHAKAVCDGALPACEIGKHFVLCGMAGQLRPCSALGRAISELVVSRWLNISISGGGCGFGNFLTMTRQATQ